MLQDKTISVIIPAYNEAAQIGGVLNVICNIPWIDEVIVVNDGSGDKTGDEVRRFPVRLTNFPENRGKGAAMQQGISATKSDILIFLDADLTGLTEDHLNTLVKPLLLDADLAMTVGRFAGGRLSTNLSQRIAPILNGQRALRRDFARELPILADHRFGVEIFISKYARRHAFKEKEVVLEGLAQVLKEEKDGLVKGTIGRYKMYGQVLKSWRSKDDR